MNWHRKTVIVTGGAGFIGSQLVKRITRYGATVFVIDNFSTGRKDNLRGIGCKIVESNVRLINDLKLCDIDLIFHLGAPSSDVLFRENPTQCLLDTINGFAKVLKFAREHQVKKLIYSSSSSVYGRTPPPQSETSPTLATNLYGAAKLICENVANCISEVKSIGLRIFAGYGPGEKHKGKIASVITLFLNQILNGEKPIVYGNGRQRRDFVYIDDIVDALIESAKTNIEGVVNIGTGRSYSFIEVLNLLMELLEKRASPTFVRKPKGYFDHTQAEISKMTECLGIHPMDLQTGIEHYLAEIHACGYGSN